MTAAETDTASVIFPTTAMTLCVSRRRLLPLLLVPCGKSTNSQIKTLMAGTTGLSVAFLIAMGSLMHGYPLDFGLKRLLFTASRDKMLIYVCTEGQGCGGWSDRQRSLVGMFLLARATGRRFGILLTTPCDVRNFYMPNQYDWTVRTEDLEGRSPRLIYPADNLSRIEDFNRVYPEEVLYARVNSEVFKQIRANKHLTPLLPAWARTGYYTYFHEAWRILMKPTPKLQRRLDRFLEAVRFHTRTHPLVGVHMRMGRNPSNPLERREFNNVSSLEPLWRKVATYVRNGSQLFVASDSMEVRRVSRRRFGARHHDTDGVILHVGKERRDVRACQGFEDAILDQLILSYCDVLFASRGGFAYRANMMRPGKRMYSFNKGSFVVGNKPKNKDRLRAMESEKERKAKEAEREAEEKRKSEARKKWEAEKVREQMEREKGERKKETGKGGSEKETGKEESEKETGKGESEKKTGKRESEKETEKRQSEKETGKRESEKETGKRESEKETGKKESKKETGKREIEKETGKRESEKETGKREIRKETGKRESEKETGKRESEKETGKRESEKETGKREIRKETGKREIRKETGKRESEKETGKRESEKKTGKRESEKETGKRESEKKTGKRESEKETGKRESEKETGKRESEKETGKRESEKETGKRESEKETGKREIRKETGKRESGKETGKMESEKETGKRESEKETGKREIRKETGKREIEKETGKRESEKETGKREIRKETGKREIRKETGKRESEKETGKRESEKETGKRESEKETGKRESEKETDKQ